MYDPNEPKINPAPSFIANLAGMYFVSRGKAPFDEYLQAGGCWGRPCYYFPNQPAAQRALDERNGKEPLPPPLPSNIAADVTFAREAKNGRC